mmetsp:Transcript_106613/g.267238  ORF Transcript_106613/g.267238 Transcript_106613/m.267238 type:complete len:235 (+) Transcript_106613:94-798(+)
MPTMTSHAAIAELELVLAALQACSHCLGQSEPRLLYGLHALVLLLVRLLVLLLQALHELVEIGRDLFHLRFLGRDELLQLLDVHCHVLLDLLLLLPAAEVQVLRRAQRTEAIRKFLQFVEVSAALIVLEVARVPVLDRREPLDPHGLAQRLPACCAIHVRDQSGLVVLVSGHQLIPSGLHRLAVTSPRREELHKHGLPCDRLFPRLLREFHRTRSAEECRSRQSGPRQSVHGSC